MVIFDLMDHFWPNGSFIDQMDPFLTKWTLFWPNGPFLTKSTLFAQNWRFTISRISNLFILGVFKKCSELEFGPSDLSVKLSHFKLMDLMGFLFYIFWVTFYGFFCFKKPIEHPSNWKWTNNQLKQYKDVWSRLRKLYSTSRDMKLKAQSNVMRIKNRQKKMRKLRSPMKKMLVTILGGTKSPKSKRCHRNLNCVLNIGIVFNNDSLSMSHEHHDITNINLTK